MSRMDGRPGEGQTDRFDLIETMAFDPATGIALLERHIARLDHSARELGFRFDRHALRNELQAVAFALTAPSRLRVLLSREGHVAVESRKKLSWPEAIVKVAAVPRNAPGDDWRLHHKTTLRGIYQDAHRRGGTFEVLMLDSGGYLTEGTFSNIFLERGDKLVTPPLWRGVLPGVLRASLIEMGEAVEGDLKPRDLEGGFFIGNAARGLVAASLVAPQG